METGKEGSESGQKVCGTGEMLDTGQEEKKSSVVFSSMFLMFFYFV